MKAWTLADFGFDNLDLSDVPTPEPGPRQLVIEVGAVSLNYRDKAVIEGFYDPTRMPRGLIPVSDAAGRVVATGSEVTRWREGDRVVSHMYPGWIDGGAGPDEAAVSIGGPVNGGLAQYMLLEEDAVVAAPSWMSDEQASTLPIAALTAWFALVDLGDLQPGDSVLVQGTGGVSLFALQLSSLLGARTIVTSSSDEKLERATALGADATVNYATTPAWDEAVLELTDGLGVDHLIDVAGGDNLNRSIWATRVGGQVTVTGFLTGQAAQLQIFPVLVRRTRLQGISVGHVRAFERMNAFLERHPVEPVIDGVYGFEDAKQAFEHLDRGPFGKVVVKIAG